MIRPLAVFLFLVGFQPLQAQDDLLDMLNEGVEPPTVYTTATFKASRVINGQSVEMAAPGVLQFMIKHRFGAFNDDFLYNFFGLDQANIRLSLDYSVNRWLNIGIGRSSLQKMVDGNVKVKLLRQASGAHAFPVTVVYNGAMFVNGLKPDPSLPSRFSDRMVYVNELLIARKFSERFSAQITPGVVHYNLVTTNEQKNTHFYTGFGARFKLSNRVSLNAEYYWVPTPFNYVEGNGLTPYKNALSLGVDIETGGHVFQLHVSNSLGHAEPQFITETSGSWADGGIHFGFNISRVFTIVKPKVEGASW